MPIAKVAFAQLDVTSEGSAGSSPRPHLPSLDGGAMKLTGIGPLGSEPVKHSPRFARFGMRRYRLRGCARAELA
jgi:hypothetical protein